MLLAEYLLEYRWVKVHDSLHAVAVLLGLGGFLVALLLDKDAPELGPVLGFYGHLFIGLFAHFHEIVEVSVCELLRCQ